MRMLIPAVIVAGLAVAACGSSSAHPASSAPPAHAASAVAATGPFTVAADLCGKFPASMNEVDGKYGMTVTVKNVSRTAYTVAVSAEFLNGSAVDTTDSSDTSAVLQPGQSQKLSIGNLTSGGLSGNRHDTCKAVDYSVQTAAGGFVTGPFQGGWKVP